MLDFDDILPYIGGFGRFQFYVYMLLVGPMLYSCMPVLNRIFFTTIPDHWCQVPELEGWNLTLEEIKGFSLPMEMRDGVMQYSQCFMYNVSFGDILMAGGGPIPDANWSKMACQYGWEYSKVYFESTIATEWDLVCERSYIGSRILSILQFASIPGLIIFGAIGDVLGRRAEFFLSLILVVSGFTVGLAPNPYAFTALSIMSGMAIPAFYLAPYLLSVEILSPDRRACASVMIWVFWAFGYMLLAYVASVFNSWRELAFITTLPAAIFFIYFWLLPESPRWYMTTGRFEQGNELIQRIAEINGRVIPPGELEKLNEAMTKKDNESALMEQVRSFFQLFLRPRLLFRLIIVCFLWTVNAIVYICLMYITPALTENPFIGFLISGAIEVPCYLIIGPLMQQFGRRKPEVISLGLCAIFLIISGFVNPAKFRWIMILFTLLAKAMVTIAFTVLYVHGAELFPTMIRSTAISITAVVASLIATSAPKIVFLVYVHASLPMLVMGFLSLACAIGVFFLPETNNQKLPETIDEADDFGRDQLTCLNLDYLRYIGKRSYMKPV